jgi:hypothetical protein
MRDNAGRPMVLGAIHRVMHLHAAACRKARMHCCILAPFGHGKTGQMVIGTVARNLGLDVNLRHKIICAADNRALERSLAIRALIGSPIYRLVFPDVQVAPKGRENKRKGTLTRDTGHAFYLRRPGFSLDASVHATGVLTSGTGGRCDWLLFDDPVDQRNAIDNPALRKKVIENIENVWLQRVEPHGFVMMVANPWHEGDAITHVQKQAAWCTLRIAVSADLSRLEMEVVNPPAEYPIPRAVERPRRRAA